MGKVPILKPKEVVTILIHSERQKKITDNQIDRLVYEFTT